LLNGAILELLFLQVGEVLHIGVFGFKQLGSDRVEVDQPPLLQRELFTVQTRFRLALNVFVQIVPFLPNPILDHPIVGLPLQHIDVVEDLLPPSGRRRVHLD